MRFSLALALAMAAASIAAAQFMRPSTEYRPMGTDRHEVSVQKNGRVDVVLRNGLPLFTNVYPMVWFDGEDEPEALKISGKATIREEIRDRLGVGQRMFFKFKQTEWMIHVYPLEPFITVQTSYVNDGKKPVTIKALLPWCTGGRVDGGMSLGPRTQDARILRYPDQHAGGSGPIIESLQRKTTSDWMTALVNPSNGHSLLLGFLTAERAWPTITLARSEDDGDILSPVQAISTFDPPAVVAPGERLDSDVLYISLSEATVFTALERFGQAFSLATRSEPVKQSEMPTAALGLDWADDAGNWAPREGAFADAGDRPAVTVTPLTVAPDSPLRRDRPGSLITTASGQTILDITAPGAEDYVRDSVAALRRDHGVRIIDGVHGLEVLFDNPPFHNDQVTEVMAYRMVLRALRAGLGEDGTLIGSGPVFLESGFVDGWRSHPAALTRFQEGGAVRFAEDAVPVLSAARQYYLAPWSYRPVFGPKPGGVSAAVQTGQGLSGPLFPADQYPVESVRPLRPIDLFVRDAPRIWCRSQDMPGGPFHTVAVFNWSEELPDNLTIQLDQLGIPAGVYYAVYDVTGSGYAGTVDERLAVETEPLGVRVLALRPYRSYPQVIAATPHPLREDTWLSTAQWNPARRSLSGIIEAVPAEGLTIQILTPEAYRPSETRIGGAPVQAPQEGNLLHLPVPAGIAPGTPWEVRF